MSDHYDDYGTLDSGGRKRHSALDNDSILAICQTDVGGSSNDSFEENIVSSDSIGLSCSGNGSTSGGGGGNGQHDFDSSLPPAKRNKLNPMNEFDKSTTRNNNGNPKDHQNDSESDIMEARFLISSRDAGAIIGRAGCNISRLRQTYDSSISVPDCPSPERVLTIAANVEKISKIINEMAKYIELSNNTGLSRISTQLPSKGKHSKKDSPVVEIRLLLHTSLAGGVIGKGGARITQLREETKAHIKVFSECCPMSTERVCAITGNADVVSNAVRSILNLIKAFPIKGTNTPYVPSNWDMYAAQRYGGFGNESFSSATPSHGPIQLGRRSAFYPNAPPIPPPPGHYHHHHHAHPPPLPPPPPGSAHHSGHYSSNSNRIPTITGASSLSNPGLSHTNLSAPPFLPPWSSGGSAEQQMGFSPGDDSFYSDDLPPSWFSGNKSWNSKLTKLFPNRDDIVVVNSSDGSSTATIKVPDKVVGAIIGKGGNRIKDIRLNSHAEISIGQQVPSSKHRVITVKGFANEVETACHMICNCIEDN